MPPQSFSPTPTECDRNKIEFIRPALSHIAHNAFERCSRATRNLSHSMMGAVMLLPAVSAQNDSQTGYINLDSDKPSFEPFIAGPVNSSTPDGQKVLADVANFLSKNGIEWYKWTNRVDQIRLNSGDGYCIGNLSVALSGLGAAYQASSAGATTLLTLLPTAGALIGTPTKELWILYKLMPLAGILSMVLSLGGNIVPSEINDYESIVANPPNYNGIIASEQEIRQAVIDSAAQEDKQDRDTWAADEPRAPPRPRKPAQSTQDGEDRFRDFANQVEARALDPGGYRRTGTMIFGIMCQVGWLACILVACWFMQSGSIVVWWCNFRPFMWCWYACVAVSSVIDSIVSVPFSKQWTIRASRAPKVEISPDAPWVYPERESRDVGRPHEASLPASAGKAPQAYTDEIGIALESLSPSRISAASYSAPQGHQYASLLHQRHRGRGVLRRLEEGYNTTGRISIDRRGYSAAENAFYVIISVRGVNNTHAIGRVISKLISIGVYTVGTAMFASSTLVTILVAVVVASMIIVAGVFGRVSAMWMTSELMKDHPILNAVAKDPVEAEQYIEEMLRKDDIVFEVLGHVIINGRCVKRLPYLTLSRLIGILARPFDVTTLAMPYMSSNV